ncbi:MAG: bifunctional phosphoglucose/phosphomannose isomerase [Candidatus Bathyarchaeota archaeon]|nr:bifunctional phosphoglucose/phosphomannose isomerase [Candidatus Bathyarchaeota archaeon A05DMB-5]MDH7557552.1 bifunctional phosphoglucose/phosphomannose isomerase [Candidatus Bathyarchaeota archaeon]
MPKATILNDLEEIKRIDKSNMLSFCVGAPKHYSDAARLAETISISYPKPKAIIVAGMGGSAIGGELLKDWARDQLTVPIEVCREYSLPEYANKNTLVFVVSYSGETEESLSVFLDAVKRECMSVCISSGGKLLEFAEKLSIPHLRVPSGMAPRATLPYLFVPLCILMEKIGLIKDAKPEISEAIHVLKQISESNSPKIPLNDNFSKKLALNICGTVPVVYGFGIYRAVAQRLKQQFNENSKVPAKWEFFPELNHNEIVGWERVEKLAKCFSVLLIRDNDESEAMRQRIETTKELISKESLKVFEIYGQGRRSLAKMLSTVVLGDFASVYLAVLRGVDPTPVKTIAFLKERMKRVGVKEKVIRELQKITRR